MAAQFYYSELLLKKLEKITEVPLTVLEAPAGYGKTSAVSRVIYEGAENVRWYTAVESMPDTSFSWFIRQIGEADEAAAGALHSIGYLNRSNAEQAAAIISEMKVRRPLTLVFDNFQFAAANWQPHIFNSLAKRVPDGLRTIFLSQDFGRLGEVLGALEQNICFIRAKDLCLGEEDILSFAEQLGVTVSKEAASSILKSTDGWAAAVALCLRTAGEDGLPVDAGSMDELLRDLFWKRLTDREREVLLRIGLFDHLTEPMLENLVPAAVMPGNEVDGLLHRAPLVRCRQADKEYFPHEILMRFLKNMLDASPEDFRHDVYRNAGKAFRGEGVTKKAVSCFYKAGDYEDILGMRLVALITEDFDGVSYPQVAETVLRNCPEDVQAAYPLSLLRLCYALYAGCRFRLFDREMERILPIFERLDDRQLLGEWTLMSALSDFPDLDKMGDKYRRAERLLSRPSEVFVKEEPFMFGCASMWYLFYSEPGQMLETADRFEEVMEIYNRLTADHGAGAAEIYRGECYSVQGRFEESDIQAYKAAFLSEQAGCATATYGAALLLGINAIYRSDMIGLKKAIDYLEIKANGYSFLQGTMLNTYMAETVRGYLLGLMMETGRSALWTQGEADSLTDLTFTNFMIKTCRITDLLLKKEYKKAIASVEASLTMDRRLITASTRNFMYCGLALAYMAIGRLIRASEYLDMSLEIAGKDKNYTFLACFRKYFQVLFLMPQIAAKHAKTIREIKALDIHYTRADESHIFAVLDEVPEMRESLTDREDEVARLAAEGLRNNEIAERLCISEYTVKQHLKNAFRKMNIDRRSRLIEMLR